MDLGEADQTRLESYEDRTSLPLIGLALAFLAIYAIQVLWTHIPVVPRQLLAVSNVAIWLIFVADLATRCYLSGRPASYLARHPIDVLLVALPMLRPLRILRVFTAANLVVTRGGRFAIGRALTAALAATALLMLLASLTILDIERRAPGATIRSFGTALWWSGETITTVGYGDAYPITDEGRVVAFGLMLVGVSMLGLLTASVAGWFVSKTRDAEDAVLVELRALRAEVADLRNIAMGTRTESVSPVGGSGSRD